MLDSYNSQTAKDKNILAVQTDQFLSNRLDVISAELTQAENDLQAYKSTHHIADLDKSADDYRKSIVQYDMELADLEARISILDYTEKEISKEENKRKIFPYVDEKLALVTVDGVPSALADQVKQYNAGITRVNTMLMSVEEDHPLVQEQLKQIEEIRQNILFNIVQNRQSADLQRASLIKQKKDFQNRLSDIPEQDRTYRELQRIKRTKENQYVYLVERREENAMLLASAAIPAITVDRAQMNPIKVGPKVSVYGFMAILLGLALPLCFFIGKDTLLPFLKLTGSIKE